MIAENIALLKEQIPHGVELVAVSKLKPTTDIEEAYAAGQRDFGENYATELRDKHAVLPDDVRWHFIGHLQSKQLKYYVPYVTMIHGVDTVQHLLDVDAVAAKAGRRVDVLLQVHVAREETKFGFDAAELAALEKQWDALHGSVQHVRVRGVMGMASHTDDLGLVRSDFGRLRAIFDRLKGGLMADAEAFDVVSMGMSHDWRIAVDEGSTMVRIGTAIFGDRPPRVAL